MIEGKGLEKLLDRKKYCSETPNYGPQKIRPKKLSHQQILRKLHTITPLIHFPDQKISGILVQVTVSI